MENIKKKIQKIIEPLYVDAGGSDNSFDGYDDDLLALFQAQREQDIKAFEEMIGEDEPLNIITGENARTEFIMGENSLRAELRTKLYQCKKENV